MFLDPSRLVASTGAFTTLEGVLGAFIACALAGFLIVAIVDHYDPPGGGPGPFSPC